MEIIKIEVAGIKTSKLTQLPPASETGESFIVKPNLGYYAKEGNGFIEVVDIYASGRIGGSKAALFAQTSFRIECEGDIPNDIEETNMGSYAEMLQVAISHARMDFFAKSQNSQLGDLLLPFYNHAELMALLRQAKREALN